MSVVLSRQFRVLKSSETIQVSDTVDTTLETEEDGTTRKLTLGTTIERNESSDCSEGGESMNSVANSASESIREEFEGGKITKTFSVEGTTENEATNDFKNQKKTVSGKTNMKQEGGGTTVYDDPDTPQSTSSGSFETEVTFSQTEEFTDFPFEEFSQQTFLTTTTIQGVTTIEGTSNIPFFVGTIVDGVPTTTVGFIESTVHEITTMQVQVMDTSITFVTAGTRNHFCGIVNETVYEAGPCEKWAVAIGALPAAPLINFGVDVYIKRPIITELTMSEIAGERDESTFIQIVEQVTSSTYNAKMVKVSGGVVGQAVIIANVVQKATDSGPNRGVGTTYEIQVPASVTDSVERIIREQGQVNVRQLGGVVLVNTINTDDTLLLIGIPGESTELAGGNGYPDIGFPSFTFTPGIISLTKVNGSDYSTEIATVAVETPIVGDMGDGYAATPKPAFVVTTGTFSDDTVIEFVDCCNGTKI